MNGKWVLLNGTFCLEKDAVIPITDRGFQFGEGIFTTMRVHNGKCEFFYRHLQRLQQQAEALHLDWDGLEYQSIAELIERNQAWQGIWRLKMIATAAEEEGKRTKGCLLAMMQPTQDLSFSPSTLCLFPHPVESPLAHIKNLSYLDHLYVREYAQRRGYTDAITHISHGVLLETGCSNLFWIDQGTCWLPDFQLPYLKGVFLQAILSHFTMPIQFVHATLDQVPASASVYICNALTHIRPVISIDQSIFPCSEQGEELLRQAIAQALQGNESVVYAYHPSYEEQVIREVL